MQFSSSTARRSSPPSCRPQNERITLDQALKAYTLDSAYVLDLEKQIGSLEVGQTGRHRCAGERPVQDSSRDISTTKVKLTMMNGNVTYERSKPRGL